MSHLSTATKWLLVIHLWPIATPLSQHPRTLTNIETRHRRHTNSYFSPKTRLGMQSPASHKNIPESIHCSSGMQCDAMRRSPLRASDPISHLTRHRHRKRKPRKVTYISRQASNLPNLGRLSSQYGSRTSPQSPVHRFYEYGAPTCHAALRPTLQHTTGRHASLVNYVSRCPDSRLVFLSRLTGS